MCNSEVWYSFILDLHTKYFSKQTAHHQPTKGEAVSAVSCQKASREGSPKRAALLSDILIKTNRFDCYAIWYDWTPEWFANVFTFLKGGTSKVWAWGLQQHQSTTDRPGINTNLTLYHIRWTHTHWTKSEKLLAKINLSYHLLLYSKRLENFWNLELRKYESTDEELAPQEESTLLLMCTRVCIWLWKSNSGS